MMRLSVADRSVTVFSEVLALPPEVPQAASTPLLMASAPPTPRPRSNVRRESSRSFSRRTRSRSSSRGRSAMAAIPSEAGCSAFDVGHHVLDPGVVLETVDRKVLAVARMLEAAVRHFGNDWDVRVDPDAPEVEPPGHPHRPAVVLRPDRRRQPVLRAVGPPDRLVLVGEALHRDDRPKNLVLDDLVVLAEAAHDRRRVEVAAVADPASAGTDVGVAREPVDEAGHPGELVRVVERPVRRFRVRRTGGLRALRLLDEGREEVVMHSRA